MQRTKNPQIKFLFAEIVKGYSFLNSPFLFYIKHPTNFDTANVDIMYESFYESALKHLPSEKDREEDLIKDGTWTKAKNDEIRDLGTQIETLKDTKKKHHLDALIKALNQQVAELEEKKTSLEIERIGLIGFTAETFANRRANELFIIQSLYKDAALTIPLVKPEDFEELEESRLTELTDTYNKRISVFNEITLKKVALAPNYLNLLMITDDDIYAFYGKPVVELSFFQIQTYAFGRYFKRILSDGKQPPDYAMQDPVALEDWHNSTKNAENLASQGQNASATSIVGAKKEDYEKWGMGGEMIDLAAHAKKKGGTLNMQELMRLHGV